MKSLKDAYSKVIEHFNNKNYTAALYQAKKLLKEKPNDPILLNLIGAIYNQKEDYELAKNYFKKVIGINPNYHRSHNNLGLVYSTLKSYEKAISCFHKVIKIDPNNADAYLNLGYILNKQGSYDEALFMFQKSIEIDPDKGVTYFNIAQTYADLNKFSEAIVYSEKATTLSKNPIWLGKMLFFSKKICNWKKAQQILENSYSFVETKQFIYPYDILSSIDSSAKEFENSYGWCSKNYLISYSKEDLFIKKETNKIRIAYFGSDFRNHPVGQLLINVIENHDKSKFKIYGYSFSNINDSLTSRFINSFEKFEDVSSLSDNEILDSVKKNSIHIAIDLNGHTKFNRMNLFAKRLAPIQINFLGYPGTSGANFIDYIFADKILIPEHENKYFSEKIVYLPHTYFPKKDKFRSNHLISKKSIGLSEKNFIFCAVHNPYKISHEEFKLWLDLLRKIESSVIWLYGFNNEVRNNLISFAKKYHISKDRLFFTNNLDYESYLEYLELSDILLDTFFYNSGTTCIDALSVGLPVVTKCGKKFSSRLASSILETYGLNELIADSSKSYVEIAIKLASNKEYLNRIKNKTRDAYNSDKFLTNKIFCANIEKAYENMYRNNLKGKPPENLTIENKL